MSTKRLVTSQSMVYYALSVPAVITEIVMLNSFFTNLDTISSSIQNLTPPFFGLRSITMGLTQVIPWIILIISFYALLSFRPSLLVTLLTVFFLTLTSALGQIDFLLAGLLVVSSFTSLIGFNYARASKVLSGRKLNLESHGPVIFHATTLGFDLALPIGAALGVMAVVAYVMNAIQAQVRILPEPLGTLGTLYLQSHFYLVMTTLSVAGASVWALHELLEPLILRFTMNRDQALVQAYLEVEDITRKIKREAARKPSKGRGPLAMFAALGIILVVYLILTGGPLQPLNYLLTILGMAQVQPSHTELLIGNITENTVRIIDRSILIIQDALRIIIKLLWG